MHRKAKCEFSNLDTKWRRVCCTELVDAISAIALSSQLSTRLWILHWSIIERILSLMLTFVFDEVFECLYVLPGTPELWLLSHSKFTPGNGGVIVWMNLLGCFNLMNYLRSFCSITFCVNWFGLSFVPISLSCFFFFAYNDPQKVIKKAVMRFKREKLN